MRLNDANIYPGIRPFDKEDAQFYFGRDIQIDELKARLVTSNFLAIVGSSGTGKSSLVRAGLIPRLEKDGHWLIAVSRPENSPIANIAAALNKGHVFGNLGDVYEKKYTRINLDYSSRGIIDTFKQSKCDGKLLLVIDQFEEIFRFKDQKANREESMRFINLLLTAANEPSSRIYIIITMRSDFLGRCSEFSGLPEKINEGQFLVPRLTRSQYKEAILRPLDVSSIKVNMSPSLASRVLNDIQDDPDQLPVLQHALMRTWKSWLDKAGKGSATTTVIAIDIYEDVGGMETALGKHAHEILVGLGKNLEPTAKKIFQRITEFNSDGLGIRRPIPFGDLIKVTGAKVEDVKKVIDAYRTEGVNFLMPPPDQELNDDTFIDISHESLIRKWKELGEWMKEEQLDKATLVKLAEDSDDYDNGQARLLSDRQLSGLLKWEKLKDNQFVEWGSIYTVDVKKKLDFLERSKKANYRNYILKIVGLPALLISILTFGYLYYLGQVKTQNAENERRFERSKNYNTVTRLETDSVYRMNQITTLNKSLLDANEKAATLERNLMAAKAGSNEIEKLRQQIEYNNRQIKGLMTTLDKQTDSLSIRQREIQQLRMELQELKSKSGPTSYETKQKEPVSPKFGGLSGAPIWIVFSTRQDSVSGKNIMTEISRDSKAAVTLVKSNHRDLNPRLKELPAGLYAVGGTSKSIQSDLEILYAHLNNKGLVSDSQSLEKNTVFSKSGYGIAVILSRPVTQSVKVPQKRPEKKK